ncbi:hypothetical protein ACHAP8_008212, partial [Fusarium lateritium]
MNAEAGPSDAGPFNQADLDHIMQYGYQDIAKKLSFICESKSTDECPVSSFYAGLESVVSSLGYPN